MFRTVNSRKGKSQRRMMMCVCCAALLAAPATASADRKSEGSGFKGIVLSLAPFEEHKTKKKKKQAAAKPADKKQASKSEPEQRAVVEPAGQTFNVDPGQRVIIAPSDQVYRIDPATGVIIAPSDQVYRIDLQQRVIVEPAAAVPGVDVVDGVQVPKDLNETGGASGDPENVPGDLVEAPDDPLEPFNRAMFGLNEVVDRLVIEPAARIYRAVIPRPVRTGVANVLNNLATPITLTNDILQGNPEAAANTIKRFMVNSTIGLGGLFDHATGLGEPLHREDFGQTLGTWGVGGNPYIVLPLLGPSNPRDMVGRVADTAVNPMTWILYDEPLWQRALPTGVEVVSGREAILDDYANLRKNSPDLYASVRDLYAQRRQAEIANEVAGYGPVTGRSSLPPASIPQTLDPY